MEQQTNVQQPNVQQAFNQAVAAVGTPQLQPAPVQPAPAQQPISVPASQQQPAPVVAQPTPAQQAVSTPQPVPASASVQQGQPGSTPAVQPLDPNVLLGEIQTLKAQMANMAAGQQHQPQIPDTTLQERVFFETDDNFNAAIGSRDNFNKTANAISSHAVEHILKTLPSLINDRVSQSISVYDATKDFFQQNSDLVAYEQALTKEVAMLQSARPGMPIRQTLNDAAVMLRQKLNVPVQSQVPYAPQAQQGMPPVAQPGVSAQTVYIPGAPPPVPGANNTTGFQPPPNAVPVGGNSKYATLADEVASTFGIK